MKAFVGFAGFGGVEIILSKCNFDTISVEIRDDIAEVNRLNGGNVITADILDMDPYQYIGYHLYHFSPPCPPFSIASKIKGERKIDIQLAQKIANFVRIGKPKYITLENVWLYRHSQSWDIIYQSMIKSGYQVKVLHLNSANYGVPQTRKRMIVVASKKHLNDPIHTHRKRDGNILQTSMFEQLPYWVGWYEAIEDLIPELPESKFAKWQAKRLKDNNFGTFIVDGQLLNGKKLIIRTQNNPIFTITASHYKRLIRTRLPHGKVVSMTTRALARFQSFPDWYILPDNKTLATHGIGNAVPPKMYEAILKSLVFDDTVKL